MFFFCVVKCKRFQDNNKEKEKKKEEIFIRANKVEIFFVFDLLIFTWQRENEQNYEPTDAIAIADYGKRVKEYEPMQKKKI